MATTPVGVRMDEELAEAIRDASFHIGKGWTFIKILEEGAKKQLEELRQQYNEGKAFPKREGELPKAPKRKT